MTLLSKEAILAAQDLRFEVVPVPEWGGEVRVRTMTGADRDAYEQSLMASRGPDAKANIKNVRARLVAYSIVDEAGNRLFNEEDIDALGAKSVRALDRVFSAASRLSAIGAKDVAELGKPSAPTPAGASTSTSPAS